MYLLVLISLVFGTAFLLAFFLLLFYSFQFHDSFLYSGFYEWMNSDNSFSFPRGKVGTYLLSTIKSTKYVDFV
jgi:hypothetical protein